MIGSAIIFVALMIFLITVGAYISYDNAQRWLNENAEEYCKQKCEICYFQERQNGYSVNITWNEEILREKT